MQDPLKLFTLCFLLSTGPTVIFGQATELAKEYIRASYLQRGNDPRDIEDLIINRAYIDPSTGVQHVYFKQRWLGIPVFPGVFGVHLDLNGTLLFANKVPVESISIKATNGSATVSAQQALELVAQREDVELNGTQISALDPILQRTTYQINGWTIRPFAEKVWFKKGNLVHLAWHVDLPVPGGAHWWSIVLDANSGEELARYDRVLRCDFGDLVGLEIGSSTDFDPKTRPIIAPIPAPAQNGYNVLPLPLENPNDGPRSIVNSPWNISLNASPYGWHDTDGIAGAEYTDTRGNNVHSQADTLATNPISGYAPNGSASLDFNSPMDLALGPAAYLDAAIINLFYWNNVCHDVAYQYGFDEPSGNFQMNNYGNGGQPGDFVWADAQDGSDINNANFATPPDGQNPRMQMFRWNNTSPERDSDLDNGIIAHEYAHGISQRLVGGAMDVDCLWNADQMGEGWSDYFGLMLTMKPGDVGGTGRGIGTYVLGEPLSGAGIRPAPYATDTMVNNFTYASTNDPTIVPPHGIGFVWCTMLWEMTWDMVGEYGLDPDIYNGTGGNNRALHIVIEGMKLTPCEPGFVDARDAILTANQILYNGEGDSLIWAAFAKRGLGYTADQGYSNELRDQTEAFDLRPQTDINIASILSPGPGVVPECALGIVNVECVVKNGGQDPQSFFPLYYQVDNGPIASKVYQGTLLPYSTDTVTFSGQLGGQLSVGDHSIKVWTELAGDQIPGNDTLTSTLTVFSAGFEALPYFEDFETESLAPCPVGPLQSNWYNLPNSAGPENDRYDLIPGNGNNDHNAGSPTFTPPESDYIPGTASGKYLFMDCSGAAQSRKSTLVSQCFNLQNLIAPKFKFAYWMNEGNPNAIYMDVWKDGKWYALNETPLMTNEALIWDTASLPLHNFIGSNIAIRLNAYMANTPVTIDALEVVDTFQPLNAQVSTGRDSVCAGGIIELFDVTQNPDPNISWAWNIIPNNAIFVNGTDQFSAAPHIVLLDTGHYEVVLIASNGFDTDTTMLLGGIEKITGKEHTVIVRTDAYGQEFTWQVRTPGGTVLASGGPYAFMPLGTYVQPAERFCLPDNGCYELVLNDLFEGICCQYGDGLIELFDPNGRTLVQTTMLTSNSPQLIVPFCTPGNCTTLPWTDNMESGPDGWSQNEEDDFDWVWSNTSPSLPPGPQGDHTTGSGFYWKIFDTPANETDYKNAILTSQCLDLNGITNPVLSFWVFSVAADSLSLSIESNGQITPYVWDKVNWFFNDWEQVQIDLSAFSGESIRMHFRAVKHPNANLQSIGLDDIVITGTEGIRFKVKMALEGPFNSVSGLMRDDLRAQGKVPYTEPFTAIGYVHMDDGGGEQLNPARLGFTGTEAIVDWVVIELRDGNDFSNLLATKSALVQRDGSVIDHSGNEELGFNQMPDAYVIAVRHRNHLGAMMAAEDDIEPPIKTFDFTTPNANFTYGTDGRKMIAGTGVLWAGDVNSDGSIRYTGAANDRDLVLQAIGGVVPTNTAVGYLQEDLNMDGIIKYTGVANDRDIILQNIGGSVPTNVRNAQLP